MSSKRLSPKRLSPKWFAPKRLYTVPTVEHSLAEEAFPCVQS